MRASAILWALLVFPAAVIGASCTNPVIRKEWRSLTKDEKKNWISAVKCLANLPAAPEEIKRISDGGEKGVPLYNSFGSRYDDFVYLHIDHAALVHATGFFLPWHRWYVQIYEDALRKRCNLTTPSPYWDWRIDHKDVQNSTLFTDVDPESGIGGWGSAENDFQLQTGAFAKGFALSYPSYHGLRRNYTETYTDFKTGRDTGEGLLPFITPEAVGKVLNMTTFTEFQVEFENFAGSPHVSGHFVVGGDLAGTCPGDGPPECALAAGNPMWSANEPLFWLHHGMVDKVWADWQAKSEANKWAFEGGSVWDYPNTPTGLPPMLSATSPIPIGEVGPPVTVGDVLDTTGGTLCYKYA